MMAKTEPLGIVTRYNILGEGYYGGEGWWTQHLWAAIYMTQEEYSQDVFLSGVVSRWEKIEEEKLK